MCGGEARGGGAEAAARAAPAHPLSHQRPSGDYFQRDSRQLGVPSQFDHARLLLLARVVRDGAGVTTIAYPVKEAWSIYQMFAARFNLHKKAYQHRVARVVEFMSMEVLLVSSSSSIWVFFAFFASGWSGERLLLCFFDRVLSVGCWGSLLLGLVRAEGQKLWRLG